MESTMVPFLQRRSQTEVEDRDQVSSDTHTSLPLSVVIDQATLSRGTRSIPDDKFSSNQSDLSLSDSRKGLGAQSKASALPAVASAKFLRTKTSRRQPTLDHDSLPLAEPESPKEDEMDPWIIHPMDYRLQVWLIIATIAAVVTAWLAPYTIAFISGNGLRDWTSFTTLLDLLLNILFFMDMLLHFFIAYYDNETLITDHSLIAKRYLKRMFWVDLIGCIPFDWIALVAAGEVHKNSVLSQWLGSLKILRVVRIYRLVDFIALLERMPTVSYAAVTIFRDFMYVFFVMHWGACAIYFTASLYRFSNDTFVGVNFAWIGTKGLFAKYIYSFYWAIITFATVGYGDLHPYSVGETVVTIVFVMTNIAMSAYIIASVTMLVSKSDQRFAVYRDRIAALFSYSKINHLPNELKDRMHDHLRLHHGNEDANDEAILQYYPTAIRRRVLRQLYMVPLQYCSLFMDCSPKFLDAMMAIARVELFMPDVEILSDGDQVHELYVLVNGECVITAPRAGASGGSVRGGTESLVLDSTMASVHGGKRAMLGDGDAFGELAFFTGIPSPEAVRTKSVCRVLVVPKELYLRLAVDFPLATQKVLSNLLLRAKEAVRREFRYTTDQRVLELTSYEAGPEDPSPQYLDLINRPSYTDEQRRVLRNLLGVRALLQEHTARARELRVNELLNAASRGDVEHMKKLLAGGISPNEADYDGRTALMLGAAKGQYDVAKLLLMQGADPEVRDNLGSSAVLEACRSGHDSVLEALMAAGGRLSISGMALASEMCSCVSDGNSPFLRRLLKAGADPNACDYDLRTPLHIAASDSAIAFVKLLIEEGKADPAQKDRWGNTALDEARRVGAGTVVDYLCTALSPEDVEASRLKYEANRTERFLVACSKGDLRTIGELLAVGCPVDCADYDHRTGLMIACANGHLEVARKLLDSGANPLARDNFGGNALLEALKRSDRDLLDLLLSHDARLLMKKEKIAPILCQAVFSRELGTLRLYLEAGADANAGDYDSRTALHIAASEGNLEAVQLLVEVGRANTGMVDRWGKTALDEAKRVGAADVVAFLENVQPREFQE